MTPKDLKLNPRTFRVAIIIFCILTTVTVTVSQNSPCQMYNLCYLQRESKFIGYACFAIPFMFTALCTYEMK